MGDLNSLSSIINEIKEAHTLDRKLRDKRDITLIEDSKDWFKAKREVDILPLDWQTKLREIINLNPLNASTDETGISAKFEVQGFSAELNITFKNSEVNNVNYIIYNNKLHECYKRSIPAI